MMKRTIKNEINKKKFRERQSNIIMNYLLVPKFDKTNEKEEHLSNDLEPNTHFTLDDLRQKFIKSGHDIAFKIENIDEDEAKNMILNDEFCFMDDLFKSIDLYFTDDLDNGPFASIAYNYNSLLFCDTDNLTNDQLKYIMDFVNFGAR